METRDLMLQIDGNFLFFYSKADQKSCLQWWLMEKKICNLQWLDGN